MTGYHSKLVLGGIQEFYILRSLAHTDIYDYLNEMRSLKLIFVIK